ncbi:cs-like domain protein [Nannochloropsis oceanica]
MIIMREVSVLPALFLLVVLSVLAPGATGFLLPVPDYSVLSSYTAVGTAKSHGRGASIYAAGDSHAFFLNTPPRPQKQEEMDPDFMDAAMDQAMHTVAMDWEGETSAPVKLQTSTAAATSSLPTNPFAAYEEFIEAPSTHSVYYRGHHEASFWRQGRDIIQLVVPVEPALSKSDVRFELSTKTRLRLILGETNVIFDRELSQPVYRESSFWYFEKNPEEGQKAIVIELDKRLGFSNWPKLFPEDADLSQVAQDEPTAAGQSSVVV